MNVTGAHVTDFAVSIDSIFSSTSIQPNNDQYSPSHILDFNEPGQIDFQPLPSTNSFDSLPCPFNSPTSSDDYYDWDNLTRTVPPFKCLNNTDSSVNLTPLIGNNNVNHTVNLGNNNINHTVNLGNNNVNVSLSIQNSHPASNNGGRLTSKRNMPSMDTNLYPQCIQNIPVHVLFKPDNQPVVSTSIPRRLSSEKNKQKQRIKNRFRRLRKLSHVKRVKRENRKRQLLKQELLEELKQIELDSSTTSKRSSNLIKKEFPTMFEHLKKNQFIPSYSVTPKRKYSNIEDSESEDCVDGVRFKDIQGHEKYVQYSQRFTINISAEDKVRELPRSHNETPICILNALATTLPISCHVINNGFAHRGHIVNFTYRCGVLTPFFIPYKGPETMEEKNARPPNSTYHQVHLLRHFNMDIRHIMHQLKPELELLRDRDGLTKKIFSASETRTGRSYHMYSDVKSYVNGSNGINFAAIPSLNQLMVTQEHFENAKLFLQDANKPEAKIGQFFEQFTRYDDNDGGIQDILNPTLSPICLNEFRINNRFVSLFKVNVPNCYNGK